MKFTTLTAAALVAGMGFATEGGARAETPLEAHQAKVRRMIAKAGGELIRPSSFKGRIVVVNAQGRLSDADCRKVVGLFAEATGCNVSLGKTAEGATVSLTVVDDPKEPAILVATEEHWGRVNVARLTDDLPSPAAKEKFFASRGRKAIVKALSLLLGGGASQFPGNIMNAATVRDFDHIEEQLPVDMIATYDRYLKAIGITPAEKVTYRTACKEGWAPQPTNDVQKAIWEKVHALPKNPIKIEFDPKKGR